jgi:general secretion pathway protein K
MKIALQPAPRGIALMVVMIAVFVLAVLAGAFAYSMKVETKLAINAQSETGDVWLGRSGIEVARWALAQQMSCPYVSLNQRWAGGGGDDCDTNSALSDISLDDFRLAGRKISIKITDLERKFNINTAAAAPDQAVLQQALTLVGVDASEIPSISDAIQDWTDPNPNSNVRRPNGAKSDYYQGLQPPYYAKNRPIDDLSELLLVRGVTQEIYWGPAATNHAPAAFQQVDRFGRPVLQPNYAVGLVDLFTPFSAGRINVNTASAEVLQLIPGIDESIAAVIVQQRDLAPYHSLNEVPVPPQLMPQLQRYGDVRSRTFEVQVTVEGSHRKFYAIVGRNNPRDIPVLSFYWKDL